VRVLPALLLAALPWVTLVDDARACTCLAVGIVTFPPPLFAAPRNTRPLVTLDVGWVHEPLCKGGGPKDCEPTDSHLALRTAATATAAPFDVLVDRRVAATSASVVGRVTIELAPKQPLAASTRYEIVLVEKDKKRPTRVVGTFGTGTHLVDGAPSWKGVTSTAVVAGLPTGTLSLGCGGGGPMAYLFMKAIPVDAGPIVFVVWTSTGGVIDESLPAQAVLPLDAVSAITPPPKGGGTLSIGDLGCAGNVADLPAGKAVRVRVRAVDAAGHKSAATEVVLDTRPKGKGP